MMLALKTMNLLSEGKLSLTAALLSLKIRINTNTAHS